MIAALMLPGTCALWTVSATGWALLALPQLALQAVRR